MTVLITGGAGYIGSHMALELMSHGEEFIILDDFSTGSRDAIPENIPFYEGDIGDSDLVSKIIKKHSINSIIHFAGSIVVPESVDNPLKYYLNNTVKSRSLIADAVAHKVRHFIFSSTAAVYGIPETIPVSETEKLEPISPYGSSKLMTEMMLKDTAHAHDLTYAALRYFNVSGADPMGRAGQSTPNATHLIKIATQAVLGQRSEVQVYGTDYPTKDGTGIRDYIHVSDLANAHKLALDYLRSGGQSKVLNCGYGNGHSVLDIIEKMKNVSGTDFPVKFVERRAGDPAELIANPTSIIKLLNWVPKYNDLELMAGHALNWERKLVSKIR